MAASANPYPPGLPKIDLAYERHPDAATCCRIASGAVSAAALLWLLAGFLKPPRRATT